MKILLLALMGIMISGNSEVNTDSIYQYTVTNIDGKEVSLNEYKGKVILIVNVASECGYTPQYEGLQALYEEYHEEGLVVLGFPANNFGGQEPGTNEEIKKFCKLNYNVGFPMFSKVSVKGDDQAELFKYLTSQPNPDFEGDIKWNFEKFLISRNGKLQRRFRSSVTPQGEELVTAIEAEIKS